MDQPQRNRSILVAEDNPLNFELIRDVLGSHSYEVEWAQSGEEALNRVDETFALLLLDLHMPGLDGFEVLARLRSDSRLDSLPVIVLTADAMKAAEQRAVALGADGFVTKPIDFARFVAQVERAYEHGRGIRQPA